MPTPNRHNHRENLTTDQYLVSQMDGDQFVPIWTVANFNAVSFDMIPFLIISSYVKI